MNKTSENDIYYDNKAELVLLNGFIYTVDEENPVAEAVAIRTGKIVCVGSNKDVASWIGDSTIVTDLNGKMMIPSFFEAHGHAQAMAKTLYSVNLKGKESKQEYIDAVAAFFKENPACQFITGTGWSNTLFPPAGPHKEDLDAVSKDIPIALWSEDLHSLWVNSRAMEIVKEMPIPANGVIEQDGAGEPTGTLREVVSPSGGNVVPDFTVQQYMTAIMAYQKLANSLGFTGCLDPLLEVGGNPIKAYKELALNGELTMIFRGAYTAEPVKGLEQVDAFIAARKTDNVAELFQLNSIKFFEDGVIEGGTAYLIEPYAEGANKPEGYRGEPIWPADLLNKVFVKAEQNGFQIHVHCIGDAATKESLDAIQYVWQQNRKNDCRHAITHLQLVTVQDIKRIAELGVIAVTNPYWAIKDDYFYNLQTPYLGLSRADREYPLGSFIKAGAIVASASDFPITEPFNPFMGIQIGVTRTTPDSFLAIVCEDPEDPKFREPLWLEEGTSVENMIRSFTYNGACANFLENETGSIKTGKYADMIVLDQNILRIPAKNIGNTKVLLTVFRGKVVYRDGSFA